MDERNRNTGTGGAFGDGMNDGLTERTGVSGAGAANTPEFGSTGRSSGAMGASGSQGGGTSGGGGASETERVLEDTRDTVARTAGPVVAEKMQEAVEETAHRMQGQMGEQTSRLATAVKHDAQQAVKDRVGNVANRVEDQANRAMDRAADGLETAANRLDSMADQQGGGGGAMGRAGDMAHRAADTMESTARYLRDNDVRALQHDLERMTRERPLQMVLMGVAAGWVLGKILR